MENLKMSEKKMSEKKIGNMYALNRHIDAGYMRRAAPNARLNLASRFFAIFVLLEITWTLRALRARLRGCAARKKRQGLNGGSTRNGDAARRNSAAHRRHVQGKSQSEQGGKRTRAD